jgi:hypothetical protein
MAQFYIRIYFPLFNSFFFFFFCRQNLPDISSSTGKRRFRPMWPFVLCQEQGTLETYVSRSVAPAPLYSLYNLRQTINVLRQYGYRNCYYPCFISAAVWYPSDGYLQCIINFSCIKRTFSWRRSWNFPGLVKIPTYVVASHKGFSHKGGCILWKGQMTDIPSCVCVKK